MLRPRIIPCLLLYEGGLVKTKIFKEPKYVGDPINAVKIFNEKEADELIVFDIDATVQGRDPNFGLIEKLAAECRMPFCYGGGVKTVAQAVRIVAMGVEKVAVSSAAIVNPELITHMAKALGSQSVVAVLDIRKKTKVFAKGFEVCTHNATISYEDDPITLALKLQDSGVGEIVINLVDRDGMMVGYDLDLAIQFREALNVPVTFIGAGSLNDISSLLSRVGLAGAAAGSLFVFKGKYRAVLINYPSQSQKIQLCKEALDVNI